MYQAIIIDDEETVRFGLLEHFDWAMHGVQVVQDFPDCAKAYDYIRENPVDLVVTDVITPHMDGITLAKKLRAEFPSVQIVFISGHADVQLLREALKTDAIDYILKSVDLNELSATITRVVKLLDQRSAEKKRVTSMEDQLHILMPMYRERALQSLLSEEPDTICMSYLGLNLDFSARYVCMVIRLVRKWRVVKNLTGAERLALGMEIERIAGKALAAVPGSVLFKNRNSEYVVILRCEVSDYEQDVLEVSSRIQKGLQDQLDVETAIGISEPVLLSDFRSAFEEACEALEQRYYLAEDSSIAVTKYTEVHDQKAARELVEKQLPEAMLSGQVSQVHDVLNRTFSYIRSLSQEDQDNFMLFLLLLPARAVSGLKALPGSPYRNQRKLVEHWLNCPSHIEQEQFLHQVMTESTEILQETGEPGTSAIIRQIKSIIDEQYMEQISVASLAAQVHLTPTYLCVLFKQATGKTINEYLTDERIRHAKQLLRDPSVRLYDICYRVGYLSPSYFSKLFKKQTGMPPGEYRFQAQNETLKGSSD